MGMLYDAGMVLLRSVLALVQLVIAGFLLSAIWVPVAAVVGVLNVVLVMARGEGFANIDLLFEPLVWYKHQIMVLFAAEDDFWALPYLGM